MGRERRGGIEQKRKDSPREGSARPRAHSGATRGHGACGGSGSSSGTSSSVGEKPGRRNTAPSLRSPAGFLPHSATGQWECTECHELIRPGSTWHGWGADHPPLQRGFSGCGGVSVSIALKQGLPGKVCPFCVANGPEARAVGTARCLAAELQGESVGTRD